MEGGVLRRRHCGEGVSDWCLFVVIGLFNPSQDVIQGGVAGKVRSSCRGVFSAL